jgi:hypothetical protein
MKLEKEQARWVMAYETARELGGAYLNGDWVPFDKLEIPEWYKTYLDSKKEDDVIYSRDYFVSKGRLGGVRTKTRNDEKYYSRIGKMGGRGNKK